MKHMLAPSLVALFITTSLHAATVDLRIMETTDLHSNMMDFDYYKDTPTDKFGLVRTASLIHAARQEVANSVLVDNGDVIQGSPLGDYMAAKGLKPGDVHPVYQAMNRLDYAVGNIGNHEFNYGLDYLQKALSGATFPYVNANVLDANTGKPLFSPYLIKDTVVKDREGKPQTLHIGYIGFVPPQIMVWDKANLSGKVTVADIAETAKKWVPEMRQQGAEVIIAVPHSGLSGEPYKAMVENSVYYLSQVADIDAILFGHAHAAPFKVGGRKNDPNSYVEVEKGELTFRNAADLYLYPNTLVVVKVKGRQVKKWLECAAGQFTQINPQSSAPQSLISWDGFRTYNFDVIDGVNYQIDVTQPARYDGECAPINPNAERIVNLTFNGKPIDPSMTFLIATNNYRAYGEKFAGTGEKYVAFASPDENRSVLAAYISAETQKHGKVTPGRQ